MSKSSGGPELSEERWGILWSVISETRDEFPRRDDDAPTDDIVERLEPRLLGWLADAWDEGAKHASPHGGAYLRSLQIENPYRAVGTTTR